MKILKFKELETVKTLLSFPDEGIEGDEVGTIVAVFTVLNEAYEVEFVNNDGVVRLVTSTPIKKIIWETT